MSKLNVHAHPTLIDHWAEECECANMYLDDRNVPKVKNGRDLSLVGRIEEYSINRALYLTLKG